MSQPNHGSAAVSEQAWRQRRTAVSADAQTPPLELWGGAGGTLRDRRRRRQPAAPATARAGAGGREGGRARGRAGAGHAELPLVPCRARGLRFNRMGQG